MTTAKLLFRSLFYYWRTNLAVLLGVVAGTAVIGGALIVGDSVRGSLRKMSLDRLGQIDHVLHGTRFVRQDLAESLSRDELFSERFDAAAPAILMQGGLVYERSPEEAPPDETGEAGRRGPQILRAGQVDIYGVTEELWNLTEHGDVELPGNGEIVLNRRVAEQLRSSSSAGVDVGDPVTLWVEIPSTIPRDSLLGKRDETTRDIPLTVAAILDDASALGRLNLNPNQQLPLCAFVSLATLQSNLGLAKSRTRGPNPVVKPARVNALFVKAKTATDGVEEPAIEAASALTRLAKNELTLADLGLRVALNSTHNYLSLESEQQILEDAFAEAGGRAAERLGLRQSPVLVYLANEIRTAPAVGKPGEPEDSPVSMYSVIAGLDLPSERPFGPFSYVGEPLDSPLGMGELDKGGVGEIVLNEWLAEQLNAQAGDVVRVRYHVIGSHGELPEEERSFRVRGIVTLDDTPAADRGLTPEVEGITDKDSFDEWEQPFPMKLPVPKQDEEFWDKHRATPKAFISLAAAQHLWTSRYGKLTSLRVLTIPGKSPDETAVMFTKELLEVLTPEQTGLVFQPVKYNGLKAASGTTDFSGLFIGFSFFLILSATILIGLLFRLGIERRTGSIGLLGAVGFPPRAVRRLFLTEGLLVVGLGGLLGVLSAVGYAAVMVHGLKTWWIGAIGTRFLDVYIEPLSLAIGFAISVVVAAIAVWWGMRQLRALSNRDLLAGVTERRLSERVQRRRGRRALTFAIAATIFAAILLVGAVTGLVPSSQAFAGLSWQVVAFFVVGISLLAASLAFLAGWLDTDRSAAVRGAGLAGMGRLGMRNAARHRQRSVMTVGLIASTTFVIVAVAAGHRNPTAETPDMNSGNGGFTLVAESSAPILYDLNTTEGRSKLGFRVKPGSSESQLIGEMKVMPFRLKPGQDASCLNLYQTTLPTVLGATPQMIERGGFRFSGTTSDQPWRLLTETGEDGTIPVFGDMNTLMYSLKKGVGDTIPVPDADHADYILRIAGMFDGSVLQGVLVMSEENFQNVYRDQAGFRYFLIEAPLEAAPQLAELLESQLAEYGFDAERVADRLADFLAVQNTYLSTFQTLGGLGLLLGTLGLATVMLRNVLERRSELALFRAVGFRNVNLAALVLWENAFLLCWGLVAGSVSALLAMMPHLMSIGAEVPWLAGGVILGGVFLIGMAAAFLAVWEAVRTPILATLRAE